MIYEMLFKVGACDAVISTRYLLFYELEKSLL